MLQALRLLTAAGLGFAGGLLYDLLRPLRRERGRALALLADLLFCLTMAATAFLFAMSAPNGRLGQWELTAALLGFLLWLHAIGPRTLSFLLRLKDGFSNVFQKREKTKKT